MKQFKLTTKMTPGNPTFTGVQCDESGGTTFDSLKLEIDLKQPRVNKEGD